MRYRALILAVVTIGSADLAAAVPEIPNNNLPDAAMASWYTGPLPQMGLPYYSGPVIYFNPQTINSLGPEFAAFLTAHEYCHIGLNHIQRANFSGDPYSTSWIRQGLELEADACAARVKMGENQPQAVRAAISFFANQGTHAADALHPPGAVRAQVIYNTAMQSRLGF